jgi:hypothetical protein
LEQERERRAEIKENIIEKQIEAGSTERERYARKLTCFCQMSYLLGWAICEVWGAIASGYGMC